MRRIVGIGRRQLWRETIVLRNRSVYLRTSSRRSFLGCWIKRIQAKTELPAFTPLEIIRERPVKITTNIMTLLNERLDLFHGIHHEPWANPILGVGYSIFQDVDWLPHP